MWWSYCSCQVVLKCQHWQFQSVSFSHPKPPGGRVLTWGIRSLGILTKVDTVLVLTEMELTYSNSCANRYKVPLGRKYLPLQTFGKITFLSKFNSKHPLGIWWPQYPNEKLTIWLLGGYSCMGIVPVWLHEDSSPGELRLSISWTWSTCCMWEHVLQLADSPQALEMERAVLLMLEQRSWDTVVWASR